jgi:hypothetical protein
MCCQNDVPAGPRPCRRQDPCRGDLPGAGLSAQAFYAWRKRPVCRRDYDDAHLINAALDIHHDDPGFGYRFIADELSGRGVRAGRNRVHRLCSQQRIWSVHARKRGLSRKPGPPVHDDLVTRSSPPRDQTSCG